MLGLLISLVLANPCTYQDQVHYDRAVEYHERASDAYDRFEVERDECTCACGPCAARAMALARESFQWAIYEQAELDSISPACREYLNR